jgi:hypothetical protein
MRRNRDAGSRPGYRGVNGNWHSRIMRGPKVVVTLSVLCAALALVVVFLVVSAVTHSPSHPASTTPRIIRLATWLKGVGTESDPAPGAVAYDSTGNGHDGLIDGARWASGDTADSNDPHGKGLLFNGTTQYVDIPTAVDLALSRTIWLQLDVNFSVNPGVRTETLLQKNLDSQDGSPYGVRVTPARGNSCTHSTTCAAIALYWAGKWSQSVPLLWSTGTWYTLEVEDNGTTIAFSRGKGPDNLAPVSSTVDPSGGAGTGSSSGSLYLGRGPVDSEYSLAGELQDVQLGVPLTVTPRVSSPTLSYRTASIGTPLTLTAHVSGAWGNPDDPYLPQPDIYDELHNINPVAVDLADPGSITATAVVTPPGSPAVRIPGFLDQNFVDGASGVVPVGAPTWTFRYTPRTAGTFGVLITVTTFNGTTASTSTTRPMSYRITAASAAGYRGFVQVDETKDEHARYYQYSQSGSSFFAAGADIDVPELTDPSQPRTEPGLFGGTPGTVVLDGGTPKVVGGKTGNGETSRDLAQVEQEYLSDLRNLASQGGNSARIRLDSRFLPLELCPAGNWTNSCASDLQESYQPKSQTRVTGLVGYPNGVMPQPSEVFTPGSRTPNYFGTFAIGRYNDANAWIIDQVVKQADIDGVSLQLTAWNANQDYGSGCYALADVATSLCASYRGRNNQTLVESRLYYDEARWGYSPSVLSWELFNEYGATNLTSFWTGRTSSAAADSVPGVISWLNNYNNPRTSNQDSHILTSSCSSLHKPGSCDPIDQVEIHFYASPKSVDTRIQASFLKLGWFCKSGRPCILSEYGVSGDTPADPNTWVAHKGLWLALASNYSGAWYWYAEENLNNTSNTPANPAIETPFAGDQGPWDSSTGASSPNPYTVYRGITTFLKSWPASDGRLGLDSYAWKPTIVTGAIVSRTKQPAAGLTTAGMIGASSMTGEMTAFVWFVNAASNGGDPTTATGGYPVVPAGSVTVSACSGCDDFKPGADYLVQWWDTDTGTVLAGNTTETTASPEGSVTLQTPAISTDIAVTITPDH